MLAVERYFSPDYIEHNPDIPGGNLEGFKQLLVREGLDEPRGHRQVTGDLLRVLLAERLELIPCSAVQISPGDLSRDFGTALAAPLVVLRRPRVASAGISPLHIRLVTVTLRVRPLVTIALGIRLSLAIALRIRLLAAVARTMGGALTVTRATRTTRARGGARAWPVATFWSILFCHRDVPFLRVNEKWPPNTGWPFHERSPAVSYSPTGSPLQYHRRCEA